MGVIMDNKSINHYDDGVASALGKKVYYSGLRFYQRSEVLYHLTLNFTKRYYPKFGDRTVDQMVQAARSTMQNIVEGCVDGQTSSESLLKLLGIARGSNQELLKDYDTYLKHNDLGEWFMVNKQRFNDLHNYCAEHSAFEDFKDLFPKLNDEELANMALCLCHQVDSALEKYIKRKDREFTTEGGTRERMMAARLKQRATQKEIIENQSHEIEDLKREIFRLEQLLKNNNIAF